MAASLDSREREVICFRRERGRELNCTVCHMEKEYMCLEEGLIVDLKLIFFGYIYTNEYVWQANHAPDGIRVSMYEAESEGAIDALVVAAAAKSPPTAFFSAEATKLAAQRECALCLNSRAASQITTTHQFYPPGKRHRHLIQGDPSGWLQTPVALFPPSYVGRRAVGS